MIMIIIHKNISSDNRKSMQPGLMDKILHLLNATFVNETKLGSWTKPPLKQVDVKHFLCNLNTNNLLKK